MATSKQWQLAHDAAERYEEILVPSILGPFARALVEWAKPTSGESVLDIGCGTGAAARVAAEYVGSTGHITAIDVNTGMLDVARALPPVNGTVINWREGSAQQLPLTDETYQHAICAQTIQFLKDRAQAVTEMHRILKPAGQAAVSIWCPITENPYFDTLVKAVAQHIDPDTAQGLGAAFALTDADQVADLLRAAGFSAVEVAVGELDLTLPPLREFVPRHISSTPMTVGFNAAPPESQAAVIDEVVTRLKDFTAPNGQAIIAFRSYFIAGTK